MKSGKSIRILLLCMLLLIVSTVPAAANGTSKIIRNKLVTENGVTHYYNKKGSSFERIYNKLGKMAVVIQ